MRSSGFRSKVCISVGNNVWFRRLSFCRLFLNTKHAVQQQMFSILKDVEPEPEHFPRENHILYSRIWIWMDMDTTLYGYGYYGYYTQEQEVKPEPCYFPGPEFDTTASRIFRVARIWGRSHWNRAISIGMGAFGAIYC